MKDNYKPFVMLDVNKVSGSGKRHKKNKYNKKSKAITKCDTLIEFINDGITAYHDSIISDELAQLIQERRAMKALLKNDIDFAELKKLTKRLKKIEPRCMELQWRYDNAQQLVDQGLIKKLVASSLADKRDGIQKILRQYQESAFYVLHSASMLLNLAEEFLPVFESCVLELLEEVNHKSPIFDQILQLKSCIEQEQKKIAAAMLLRIEATFYYHDLTQDDALVYVYHRLFESGALDHKAPLRAPECSLGVSLFSRFYAYIQNHGSSDTKAKLNTIITVNPVQDSEAFDTELHSFSGNKNYKIPCELSDYIPSKKPRFGWGSRLRYEFFQKHSGTVVLLESYGRWEERKHPYSNTLLLYRMREEIRRHREEVHAACGSIRGIKSLFLGKTKCFLSDWQEVLLEEENRTWARHYNVLMRQVDDYLQYPDESINTKDNLLSQLSLFITEIEKFCPPVMQDFLDPLKQLKMQLNDRALKTKLLIDALHNQKESAELLLEDAVVAIAQESRVPFSSKAIDLIEKEVAMLDRFDDTDEVDAAAEEVDEKSKLADMNWHHQELTTIRDTKKMVMPFCQQRLFVDPKLSGTSDSNQSLAPAHKH